MLEYDTLRSAFCYLLQDDQPLATLLLGGVCFLTASLILPFLMVLGYYFEILDRVIGEKDRPPAFRLGRWDDLLWDGLKLSAITVVYFAVPGTLLGISFGRATYFVFLGRVEPTVLIPESVIDVAGLVIALLLWIGFGYVLPAALGSVSWTGKIESAFSYRTLSYILPDRRYAIAWGLALAVFVANGAVTIALNQYPYGYVLASFLNFYATTVAFYLYGRGIAAATPSLEQLELLAEQARL